MKDYLENDCDHPKTFSKEKCAEMKAIIDAPA